MRSVRVFEPALLAIALTISGASGAKADGNPAILLGDLDPTSAPVSSRPYGFTEFEGAVYFGASTRGLGSELWRSEIGSGTASLISDFVPGSGGLGPSSLTVFRGRLWFRSTSGLWSTNGTPEGFRQEVALNVRRGSLTLHNDLLFFNVFGSAALWRTDGTEGGTFAISPDAPGIGEPLVRLGSLLYLAGPNREGLYETDGSRGGTRLVVKPPERIGPPFSVANTIFFTIFVGGKHQLWFYDPQTGESEPAGRRFAGLLNAEFGFTESGGKLFFTSSTPALGQELWGSEPPFDTARLVRDIEPGRGSSFPRKLVDIQGRLFFSAFNSDSGVELWTSDGTAEGTQLVVDLVPGPDSSSPQDFRTIGNTLFFRRNRVPGLFRSDGTAEGTIKISDATSRVTDAFVSTGERLYFAGSEGESGLEPFVSDGTAAGTSMIANIAPDAASSSPERIGRLGDEIFLAAGRVLWKSDGTPEGTLPVSDVHPAPGRNFLENDFRNPSAAWRGLLFFVGLDSNHDLGIWRTDGSEAGTFAIGPGTRARFPRGPIAAANRAVVFTWPDEDHGAELWRSDGSIPGTYLLVDLVPGSGSSNPRGLFAVGDGVVYAATISSERDGLYRTDGTMSGTHLIRSFPRGQDLQELRPLAVTEGTLFFLADLNGTRTLWRTDGTVAGTFSLDPVPPVLDIDYSGQFVRVPPPVVAAAGKIFLPVITDFTIPLLVSDGTRGGTRLLRDIAPDAGQFVLAELAAAESRIYYQGFDDQNGNELWTTDGTREGTHLVRDLSPGPASTFMNGLTATGDRLVFITARRTFVTDGTEAGTFPLTEQMPETRIPTPIGRIIVGVKTNPFFGSIGDRFLFAGSEDQIGEELFAVELPRCGNGLVEPNEACDDSNNDPADGCDDQCRLGDIEVPLPGGLLVLLDSSRKDALLLRAGPLAQAQVPTPATDADPLLFGAVLTIENLVSNTRDTIILEAQFWSAASDSEGNPVYHYSQRQDRKGYCQAKLSGTSPLELRCFGGQLLDLVQGSQGEISVDLTLGRSPGAQRFCMQFGGRVLADRPRTPRRFGLFIAQEAPAPKSCFTSAD